MASRGLRPPLTIGLFGAWGSGKSFLLNRIETLLGEFTQPGAPDGYLSHVKIVRFNAWQYAEANLWASLVDHVLQTIGPAPDTVAPQEVRDAEKLVKAESAKGKEKEEAVEKAKAELETAKKALAKRRRRAWWVIAGLLVLAAVGVVVALFGGPGRILTGVSVTLALLGSASAAYQQGKVAQKNVSELVEGGKAGFDAFGRLVGRPEELAVRAADARLQEATTERDQVRAATKRLRADADRLSALAAEEPLRALLQNLSTVTEYREQLSLVARTRERFDSIDKIVGAGRVPGRRGVAPTTGPELERVVIVIDDLDRCPPEKVVSVLEAVHLLFDFRLFVVVLAVDTRWLDQSLRIRYRQLLGKANTAAPVDYLEKIIQIPIQLRSLDENLVRTMISGLTRQVPQDSADAQSDEAPAEESEQPQAAADRAAIRCRPSRPPTAGQIPAGQGPPDQSRRGDGPGRGRVLGRYDAAHSQTIRQHVSTGEGAIRVSGCLLQHRGTGRSGRHRRLPARAPHRPTCCRPPAVSGDRRGGGDQQSSNGGQGPPTTAPRSRAGRGTD